MGSPAQPATHGQTRSASRTVCYILEMMSGTMSDPVAGSAPPEWNEFSPAKTNFLSFLYGGGEPVFAVLDAAQDDRIPAFLEACGEEHASLYDGQQASDLKLVAPYLVSLPPASKMFCPLLKEGWGKNWGFYLTSQSSLPQVRYHLQHFVIVQSESGRPLYFRFYDPRVLHDYLATCAAEERATFFGPMSRLVIEGKDPAVAVEYRNTVAGLARNEIRLGGPSGQGA